MGEQPYRQVDRVEDVCEDYDVLIGPDGFQCFLGEPEDRCWRRDGKAVVDELNRLHAEIARLKADAAKDAEMIADLACSLESLECCVRRSDLEGRTAVEEFGLQKVDGEWRRVK